MTKWVDANGVPVEPEGWLWVTGWAGGGSRLLPCITAGLNCGECVVGGHCGELALEVEE